MVFEDSRGFFFESFNEKLFHAKVSQDHLCRTINAVPSYGVIRGLHFQHAAACTSKLVSVLSGKILDVAVDIRKGSPTYGQHFAV